MAQGEGEKIVVGRLTVPLALVLGIVTVFGGTIVAALDREAGVRSEIAEIAGKVQILESNSKRSEGDVLDCRNDLKKTDRIVIGIEKKLEYLVLKVDEIASDVKDHKRDSREQRAN